MSVRPTMADPRARRRVGFSALEVLFAAAAVGVVAVPLLLMLQTGARTAHLDEFHVLARRRATVLFAAFEAAPYLDVRELARSGPAAGRLHPALEPSAQELPPELLPSACGANETKKIAARAFFRELEPGFGELAVLMTWDDPAGKQRREFFESRFLSDPIHWRHER